MNLPAHPIYRVGEIEVDPTRGCLRRQGQEQNLRQKTFQLLLYLLEQRGRLVTKEELMAHAWPDTAVTDDALVQCIGDIRRLFGDDPKQPRFIKTVPKAGYRFIAPVEELWPELDDSALHTRVEVEEITAVEFEIEETCAMPLAAPRALPARRWLRQPRALAPLLVAAPLLALALYFAPRAGWPRATTETALPRVPGKRAVTVMYFENQSGDRELDWLREGLADMFITNLARAPQLTVLSRQQLYLLLERGGHSVADPLRLDEAQEVARRAQAEVIVTGSFARLGHKTRLDARLHDARTGQLLAAEGLLADEPAHILTQVDALSFKLAAHLQAAPRAREDQRGLAEVMTDNLEAYRCYSLALEQLRSYHLSEALALLQQAIARDPQFAAAYARSGYIHAIMRVNEAALARPYLEKAFQLAHRLTPKDKLYVLAWYAMPNDDETIRAYQEIIKQYPQEIEAYWRLGLMLQYSGHSEEAIETLKRGLVMDPEAPELYNQLGNYYSGLGRHPEALAAHQRYVQLAPRDANAHDSLAMTYNEMGRHEEAITELNQALALKPQFHFAHLHLGDAYFGLGRYRDALRQYQHYLRLAPSDWDAAVGWQRLTRLHWKRGDLQQATRCATQILRRHNDFGDAFLLALARGALTEAERIKARFFAHPPNGKADYLDGYYALKTGRAEEAIAHFQAALCQAPTFFWYADLGPDALANAYLELGRWEEASAEYERLARLNPRYPLVLYRLGLAYERKGDQARARSAYERFLEQWRAADADIPELSAARARLAAI